MNYLQAASSLLSFRLPFNPSWFICICPVYLSYTAFQHLSRASLSQFQIMGSNLANWRKIKICFLWIRPRLNGTVRSPLLRRKSYWGEKLKLPLYTPFRYKWGVETAPLLLNPGSKRRWVVSIKPRPVYLSWKSHRYPLNSWLGDAPDWWNICTNDIPTCFERLCFYYLPFGFFMQYF